MFFILSKTLNYLSMPIVLIVISLVLAGILKIELWRRRFFYLGLGMLLFFSNAFIANEVMKAWEVDPVPLESIKKEYKLAIVLSGVILGDTEIEDRAFIARGDRLYHPVLLYKMGKVKQLFASGGTGRLVDIGQREAEEMVKVFENMGVAESDIFFESEARNTHENARESIKWMDGRYKESEVLLITSAFHMRRSHACFKKLGFSPDVFSCDIYTSKRRWSFDRLFIPSVDALRIWHKLIKEWTGMAAYWVAGYI